MTTEKYLSNIADYLGILSNQVKIRNAINLYDINIVAEDFYSRLLNKIFDASYKNINTVAPNAKCIDLYDETSRVAIQVTSDNTSSKIKHTINKFIDDKLYEKYDNLIILILTEKKQYTTDFDTKGLFSFDKNKDVIDLTDIIRLIRPLNIDKLKDINDFLCQELFEKYDNKTRLEANEVETILDLIEYISRNRQFVHLDNVIVDPDYKINKRFKEFATNIKSQYKELLAVYGNALVEVESEKGDSALDIITRLFLQDLSLKALNEAGDDPLIALNDMTAYFEEKLSANGKKHDANAIKFYLLDKVIECSVFPNERTDNGVS